MITKDRISIMDIVNNINVPESHVPSIHIYRINRQ